MSGRNISAGKKIYTSPSGLDPRPSHPHPHPHQVPSNKSLVKKVGRKDCGLRPDVLLLVPSLLWLAFL
jgi:hypothetical protein